jgi:TolB-like protein
MASSELIWSERLANQLTELLKKVDDLTREIHQHICVPGPPEPAESVA